jgi:hypothetical protein
VLFLYPVIGGDKKSFNFANFIKRTKSAAVNLIYTTKEESINLTVNMMNLILENFPHSPNVLQNISFIKLAGDDDRYTFLHNNVSSL